MFETTVIHPRGGQTKCMVYPYADTLGILFPDNIMPTSHRIRFKGTDHEARMCVVVSTEHGEEFPVDPFDFR